MEQKVKYLIHLDDLKYILDYMEDNRFYVYALLDTRKPKGEYYYERDEEKCGPFEYPPFYVGKGTKNRYKDHFKNYNLKDNSIKSNKINKIIKETGNNPISVKIIDNLNEDDAFKLEEKYIKIIGKIKLNNGPLSNVEDGEFTNTRSGWHHSIDTNLKIRKALKGRTMTEESRIKNSISHSTKSYKITSPIGDTYIVNSITKEFCEEHALHKSSMSKMARKEILTHKGWTIEVLKDSNQNKNSYKGFYKCIDIINNEYYTNSLSKFCEEYNLTKTAMLKISNNLQNNHFGWKCIKIGIIDISLLTHFYDILKYIYTIIDPNENKYITDNLSQFSKEHNLFNVHMYRVANGKTESYKGWKVYKELK